LVFLVSVSAALFLSRKYGSWMDRLNAALASLSSAPSWIFGIILIVLLAGQLRILPFPKVIDPQYADFSPRYIKLLLSQLVMPVMAIFLSVFFQGVYTWRTFFLIYSQEDYVEMAKALGLTSRKIERQYILKPTFPYVITNFALMMITVWETSIALEVLFYWPGIGPLFLNAVNRFNTSLIVAVVVIFAYLLAITVFLLDLVYAVMDPRVRIGQNNDHLSAVRSKQSFSQRLRRRINSMAESLKGFGSGLVSLLGFWRVPLSYRVQTIKKILRSLRSSFIEIRRYPTAIVGLGIILLLIGVSIYTVIAIPYNDAVELWRTHTASEGIGNWEHYPRNASPTWVNFFRVEKLPETLILNSTEPGVIKDYDFVSEETTDITISYVFDYLWGDFPEELTIFFDSQYEEKTPHISVSWLTPDGREIRLSSFSAETGHIYRIAQDERLSRKLGGLKPQVGLFADPDREEPVPVKGSYELRINAIVFEDGSDLDAEFILYGRVYGIAGTDNHRRDLKIAMLWGTPVALAFGLLGAIGTSLAAMFISAFGVWFGGWVDNLIQRITEVNIILPTLPVAIMISVMYSKSIWVILGVIILLNIFGSSIKNYRAAFLQVKEADYIEGAMAYGAKDGRIVLNYMIPRIVPVLLPQLVIMVPGYVFFEATLAYLGLSDPYLPTWGKVVHDAFTNGAHQGLYYWILEPIGLLLITGLAFALLGFAMDRIINVHKRRTRT
jgi:peptide/nickel transport system permease protein